ncbi:MAG: helix-turn-helix transcriptional regulator [Paraburkholderia sp.]|uniref:helix-turn-helix domain-containing protein n=1 Tax=Paraburkholderia sp. TaxID=1926495 RepID=UPI003C3EC6C1
MNELIIQARHADKLVSGARHAHVEVSKAVARGDLAPAATLPCADCGETAQAYDHRDYGKPLAVDAVCDSCNARRGVAIPSAAAAEKYLSAVIEHERGWKARMPIPLPAPIDLVAQCESYRDAVLLAWELRSTRNMTRAALAERVGIHAPHITEMLSGGPARGKRTLPAEQIDDFEWAVGNRVVTQYLLYKAGIALEVA